MKRAGRIAACGLVIAAAGCMTAPVVVAPSWTSTPTPESLGDAFPGFAADAGIEGAARLVCAVTVSGMLEDCSVATETPAGLGFGAAALSLSDEFRARPSSRNGVPVPSSVAFAVNFRLPPIEPVLPWAGPAPDPETLSVARQVVARMRLSLTSGADAVQLEGLPADRVDDVRQIIATVQRETGAEMREAHAVNLARTQGINSLRMLTQGQRRPSPPNMSDEEVERAQDQLYIATQKQNDRLRALYCARYGCERD